MNFNRPLPVQSTENTTLVSSAVQNLQFFKISLCFCIKFMILQQWNGMQVTVKSSKYFVFISHSYCHTASMTLLPSVEGWYWRSCSSNLFEWPAVLCERCLSLHDNSFVFLLEFCLYVIALMRLLDLTAFCVFVSDLLRCFFFCGMKACCLLFCYFISATFSSHNTVCTCRTVGKLLKSSSAPCVSHSYCSECFMPKNNQKTVVISSCATSLRLFYFLVFISPYFSLLPQMTTTQDQCNYNI